MIRQLDKHRLQDVSVLLKEAELPTGDLDDVDWFALAGFLEQGKLIAAGGLERCDDALLLRSLVVRPSRRGSGIASQLVSWLLERVDDSEANEAWLLTTDAENWFSRRFAFVPEARANAPAAIQRSSQFSELCPGSATLMRWSVT